MSEGKRKVNDDFSKKPPPPSPETEKKAKPSVPDGVPNDVYICEKDDVMTGLYYHNVKLWESVFTGDGVQLAKDITDELPICSAAFEEKKSMTDRKGESYTLPAQLKIKFKTPQGLETSRAIVTKKLGRALAPTKGPVADLRKPAFNVERRARFLAVTGDTYDCDAWFRAELAGTYSNLDNAVMIPIESDDDANVALQTLRNLCQYLGYDLFEHWSPASRAPRPPPRARDPCHALTPRAPHHAQTERQWRCGCNDMDADMDSKP